jgi:glycerol-3-phosphate dehydrogenase
MLGGARSVTALGVELGQGLFEVEAAYLCREEWAVEVDDILWRRSKLGLCFSEAERARLQAWLTRRASSADAPRAPHGSLQTASQTGCERVR